MNMTEFKAKYPDLHKAIFEDGEKAGHAKGLTEGEAAGLEKGKAEVQAEAKAEGAKAERERIQAVEAQLIPGHEDLIQTLKFDGETTGPQAAVQILQAEKTLRQTVADQLKKDSPDAVAQVIVPDVDTTISSLPDGPDKWKAEFEKDPKIQAEFKTVETYVAFRTAEAAGKTKILSK